MPKYDCKDRMLSMWLCGTFTRVGPVYGRQKILPLLPPLPCSGIRVVGGWEVEEIFDNVLVAGL